jgi:MinD-like ATPase involved in chromosome partitioning or flagellar assembly
MADPESGQKERIIKFISDLNADYILVDLGAGTSYNVLDFFNMSDEGIVIVSPDPASMQNAYAFIKTSIYRRIQRKFAGQEAVAAAIGHFRDADESSRPRTMMEFYDLLCTNDPSVAESVAEVVDSYRPLLIINMASSEQDQRVAEILQSASKRFLNVDIRFCGIIISDQTVRRAVQRMELLDFDDAQAAAAQQIRKTVQCLLNCGVAEGPVARSSAERPIPKTPTMGITDKLDFLGRQFHIQTEDLGFTGRSITTQVFCEGKVIFSSKREYPSSVNGKSDRNLITEMMRQQHFNVIRELESKKSQMLGTGS